MAIIGIDLGTTNSLAAVWDKGTSQLIPNAFGEYLTPSVVSIDEQGNIYVGKTAKERLISDPKNTASIFKRFMGTEKRYCLQNKNYSSQELSSFVLNKLKTDAEIYLGEPVTEAVISVPAYFNNAQRDATKKAGELANLKVERIINEPSAAALACQQLYPEVETVEMVFDFGGGTLDVSIVDCFENIINVVSVSGDNHLGGCDFDLAIAEFFCKQQNMDYRKLSNADRAAVLKSAEICKRNLSENENTEMIVYFGGEKKTFSFDTENMIRASAEIFQRILEPIRQAVTGAEIQWEEINRIILVGGSCKMPAVRLYLQHFLKKEVIFLGSPDTIVALGTATYAGIKERKTEIKDMLLTDVCPFTLGINLYNDVMSPIIERNTTLPTSKEQEYVTVHDNQEKINFGIYQGESLYARDNILLGNAKIPVPREKAGKESILVRFTYDINGILEVDVIACSTKAKEHLLIIDKKNMMNRQEIDKRLKELATLKIHPREKEENTYLISRCEALYAQAGKQLREFLVREMQYFEYLIEKQNDLQIKKGRKRFSSAMDTVEESMNMFDIEMEFDAFSDKWYKKAIKEDSELGDSFEEWFGKGNMTS